MTRRRLQTSSLFWRAWRDKRMRVARWGIFILVFLAVFGDFIANDKPLYCRIDGASQFPAVRAFFAQFGLANWNLADASVEWSTLHYDQILFAPVPYSAGETDLKNANFKSPFAGQQVRSPHFRHWLGTDNLGRDVIAGLIHGARIALLVGLCSMLLAALVGIPVGAFAGFLGDDKYTVRIPQLVLASAGMICMLYFIVTAFMSSGRARSLSFLLAGISIILFAACLLIVSRVWKSVRKVAVPADMLILRSIEILRSIPAFFLIFAVLGMIHKPRLWHVILLIAIFWCLSIIRFVRAEALKLRDQTFIQSGTVLGLSQFRIVWRHIIPNAIGPALIALAFGVGTAVLIESALSFLGIGIAPEVITWGKMLNLARSNFSAWWMAVLPGIAIFATIAVFNRFGDVLESQLSGRQ